MGDDPVTVAAGDVPAMSPDESIYRRCLRGWFSLKKGMPSIRDFMPRAWESEKRKGDVDGLSVDRAHLTGIEQAATCPWTGKKHHVAKLTLEFVESLELSVKAMPISGNRGHALIPELNSIDRRDPEREVWIKERAKRLQDSAQMVYNPT